MMGMRLYVVSALFGLAATNWLVFRWLMRKLRRFQTVSPLVELMDCKSRHRYRLYAKGSAASMYILAASWLASFFNPQYQFMTIAVGIVAQFLAGIFYRRNISFLRIHDAFDGGVCSGPQLATAVGLYYASRQGTGKIIASLSRDGEGGLLLSHGDKSYVLRPEPGLNPWVMAMVLVTVAPPVNVYGLLVEHIGGSPTTEILTDPEHPAIP